MLRWILIGAGLVLASMAAFMIYVRTAPSDPSAWSVDPFDVTAWDPRNSMLAGPAEGMAAEPGRVIAAYDASPEAVAEALDAVASAEPRTVRLSGGPGTLQATYIARSRVFGFPDYVSAAVRPAGDGSELAIYSRARFGTSDHGVNAARVERWLAALVDRLASRSGT